MTTIPYPLAVGENRVKVGLRSLVDEPIRFIADVDEEKHVLRAVAFDIPKMGNRIVLCLTVAHDS